MLLTVSWSPNDVEINYRDCCKKYIYMIFIIMILYNEDKLKFELEEININVVKSK